MVDVSFIIVNRNTRELLGSCLDSISGVGSSLRTETIVVDNASTDGSVEDVRERHPGVKLQVNQTNERFARPNNDGMKIATGRYLFFLNSDARLQSGAVERLVTFMDLHPEVGACGPMMLYPDGRLQRSVSRDHTPWTHFCDMLFLDRILPRSGLFGGGVMETYPYDEHATQPVSSLMGAAFLVRRPVLDTTGTFDENLSIYYNEMDWFRRMRSDGWKIYYVHDAQVVHVGGFTTSMANRSFVLHNEMYDNVVAYYRKHFGRLGAAFYRLFLVLGFFVRSCGWSLNTLITRTDEARLRRKAAVLTLKYGLGFRGGS